jgi:predicted transcriptional regulator
VHRATGSQLLLDHEAMLRHACAMGLEGIVAKRKDAPYRSGYVETWLKVKCSQTESFEDGRQYKSLKRHLSTRPNPGRVPHEVGPAARLSPGRPELCQRRSELAKAAGLGRKREEPALEVKRRGRRKAA